jgi:hypothetical protein
MLANAVPWLSTRNARVRFAGCGVVVAALAVTNAFAAATWTIKPGGATTASATNPGFKDLTTGSTFACASATFSGRLKSGGGLSGSEAGSISAVSFLHCSGPLGEVIVLTPTDLPWHLNLSSYSSGVATGSISHIQMQFAFPSCTAVIDGTSATASNGHVKFRYADRTGRLTTLVTGGDLHFYNVSGCAGIVRTGDALTVGTTFTLSPKQTITSP